MTRPSPRREPAPDAHLPFEELAVGYALSALEPDEQVLFLTHLSSCARCERAVADHQETAAQLAQTAPSVEPPASLLAGILAGVQGSAPPSAVAEPTWAAPVDLAARRDRRSVTVRRSHLLTSAAAVVALLLGLGGWNAALQRDVTERAQQYDNVAAAVRALENPQTRTVRLTSEQGEVHAIAVVQGSEMSLVVDGLAPNDAGTVYVLWGQSRYGDVRAVGTFDVESPELGVLNGLRLEPGIGELTTLMVTREQGRTAPAMTTEQVLVSGSVQQT